MNEKTFNHDDDNDFISSDFFCPKNEFFFMSAYL